MNKERMESLMQNTKTDVDFAIALSNEIIQENSQDLDDLMRDIQRNVVNVRGVPDQVIEEYLAELTNALYFINTRVESFGFYEDITKANAKLKYNESYSENQLNAIADNKKVTVADNQLYAEKSSMDETTLNLIYSRSMKILSGKIDSAREMIRTLSKILSVHMNDAQATRFSSRVGE